MARSYYEYSNQDGTVSHGFSECGCGTTTYFKEITKDKYEEYKAMKYGELSSLVQDTIPQHILMGYGYYGCKLRIEDGMYFLGYTVGSSCD